VQARTRELTESLEQQTATADVLKVISRSAIDVQRVLDALVESAARLTDANDAAVFQAFGDRLRLVAHHGQIPTMGPVGQLLPLVRGLITGRTVIDRRTIQVADILAEADEYPESHKIALQLGYRTALGVPLVHGGNAIGMIFIRRTDVRPFTKRQIELVSTFADQAVIAIQNTHLFEAEQASKRELQESLEYQTAMSNVLAVISRSPNELQPVLDAIVETAKRLCEAERTAIWRLVKDRFQFVAATGNSPDFVEQMRRNPPPTGRQSMTGRTVIEKRTLVVEDRQKDFDHPANELARKMGSRSMLSVPLMREDEPLGVISLVRDEVRPFSARQIGLVEAFAAQAVIAIENTRLFEEVQARQKELEARTKELQETLEYQTATSDILSVISRSPNELQPVLNAIVSTAFRLCPSDRALIMLQTQGGYRAAARAGFTPVEVEERMRQSPIPVDRGSVFGRVVQQGRTIHVFDVRSDSGYALMPSLVVDDRRTVLGVPLLRESEVAGVIVLLRTRVEPYTQRQIGLIETFADQAVIAMSNARLFEAEQARTHELSVALQRQMATSEILGIISASPGKLEPVFDAILERARELCAARFGHLLLFDGPTLRPAALHNVPPAYAEFWHNAPPLAFPGTLVWRLRETKQPYQLEDTRLSEAYRARVPLAVATVELAGARTLLGVPMLKDRQVIGAIVLYRTEVRLFDEQQVALLSSFADQAVIAIENARLFEEVQARTSELSASLEQQTATADVLKVISRAAFDLPKVLDTLVESAASLCDSYDTAILQTDGDVLRIVSHSGHIPSIGRQRTVPRTRGSAVWRAVLDRQTIHLPDPQSESDEYPESSEIARRLGYHTMLAVPLVGTGEAVGAITLRRSESEVRPFTDRQIELLQTFADQAVIAIENARLFAEVQSRTRELAKTVEDLEIASQHKSQFVANMSHELRTPLAAILGYAELMQEGFYEPLGQKSLDALTRIRSNGKHLLGLINTVLDIAKIESGQFTLSMAEYAIESVVETVRSATESLAQNKKLTLKTEVAKSLPVGLGDEQRLTQVLLNLVGNAVKFTDTGEVRVTAKVVNGHFNVSVIDTGPGIPEEHQARIFEQFHQVDGSNTKARGGTGLGLAIAKQIVEMHGGLIWVESTLGKGSTFQMKLPTRAYSASPHHEVVTVG
jgi:signal transduction histidine kinase/putative methionine-R-sulfoxide reductase with GAF domain